MLRAETAAALMRGAYDLHLHTAPSPFGRLMDDFEILRSAETAGMAGVLFKSHYESTAARAEIANRYSGACTRAYGAVALNWPVGGLNPFAVSNALRRGAKMVFMPTRDAANSLESGDMPGDFFSRRGLTILLEDGTIKPEVYEIMDEVKAYGAVLATGHLYARESVLLCREGRARGVRMALTHPEFSRTRIDAQTQRELAELGVYIEKCWYNIAEGEIPASEMALHIRTVGAEHCFMTTDRGQGGREAPVQAMQHFILAMLEQGVQADAIHRMTHALPKEIVG